MSRVRTKGVIAAVVVAAFVGTAVAQTPVTAPKN
jgi:hypothetical protein